MLARATVKPSPFGVSTKKINNNNKIFIKNQNWLYKFPQSSSLLILTICWIWNVTPKCLDLNYNISVFYLYIYGHKTNFCAFAFRVFFFNNYDGVSESRETNRKHLFIDVSTNKVAENLNLFNKTIWRGSIYVLLTFSK